MKRTFELSILAAVALLNLASAQAQVTDSTIDRIAYLEAKLASMESTLQDYQAADTHTSSCLQASRSGRRGIIGGYDFLLLSPSFADGYSYQVHDTTASTSAMTAYGYPADYCMAPRFWLGYQGYNGLGARLRYSQFDQQLMARTIDSVDATRTIRFANASASDGEIMSFSTGMELHVLDFDITKDFEMRRGELTTGAGLRYARLQFDFAATVTDAGGAIQQQSAGKSTLEGVGPSAFVDFKAPVRQSRLSVIGGLRGTVLFGQENKAYDAERFVAPVTQEVRIQRGSNSTGVVDASLGLQYDRCLTQGIDGFIRCAWEGQLWMEVGSPAWSGDDMAMQGLSVGVGVTR